jgi:hypothetical protein
MRVGQYVVQYGQLIQQESEHILISSLDILKQLKVNF